MVSSSTSNRQSQGNPDYPSQKHPLVGGRYAILKQLSEGAFGHTFLAKDIHLPGHPQCVLKQLKPQSGRKATAMSRRLFDQEAEVLYTLGNHPQIPQLLAHFEDRHGFYLAQEYIEGRSLSDELKQVAPAPESQVIKLVREILEVLVFVHQQQVIHRDLKPANLIRRRMDHKIVMIDFGAVKQVSTQFFTPKPGETDYTIAIGTVGYIPNEQMGGRPRYSSDIYAVGIIGIQALTGVAPNDLKDDDRSGELMWRDRAPDVTPEFAAFLDRMVRYDFRARYATANEALKDIVYLASGEDPSHFPTPASLPVPPTVVHPPTHIELPSAIGGDQFAPSPALESAEAGAGATSDSGAVHNPWNHAEASHSEARYVTASSSTRIRGLDWLQGQIQEGSMAIASRLWQRRHGVNLWYAIALVGVFGTVSMVQRGVWLSAQRRVFHTANTVTPQVVLAPAERLVNNLLPQESPEDISKQIGYQIAAHVTTAQTLAEKGKIDESLASYQKALSLDSKHIPALTQKCALLNQLNEPESALSACQDLLVADPDNVVALWGLGKANYNMAFYDNALGYYEQALAVSPGYEPAQTGWNQVRRAMGQ